MTLATVDQATPTRDQGENTIDRIVKKKLLKKLQALPKGQLVIKEGDTIYSFGGQSGVHSLSAEMTVHHPDAYRAIALGGSIGAAEAYMAGYWSSPDLVQLVRLMSINLDFLNQLDGRRFFLQKIMDKLYHRGNRNSKIKAKENIAAHYDLSNDFFSLFLDAKMMYSSAVYPTVEASLEEAASYKLELICQKLALGPDDHLLEIGTGWGGLAVYAAKNYGCQVTTTTISAQQHAYARELIKQEGLEQQITLLKKDYRELTGQFSKLVSVEMIEAVGPQYYKAYFRQCSELLSHNGLMLLQSITIPEQRYFQALHSVDFIQRYIFPGGSLPSHEAVTSCLRRYTNMNMVAMEEIGHHYAQTLMHWRERFFAQQEKVQALGFDQHFMRMWEYYLCYCEGGFREHAIGTAQYLFAKPGWRAQGQEHNHVTAAN